MSQISPKVGMEHINSFLTNFGTTLNGTPHWRLVWSDDQLEYRKGVFNEFYGDVFLRTIKGTREVRKYNYIKERWILERYFPPEMSYNPEIPTSVFGNYEPVYVFEDKNGNFLQPTLKVVEFIVVMAEKSTPQTEKQIIDDLLLNEEKEVAEIYEALSE